MFWVPPAMDPDGTLTFTPARIVRVERACTLTLMTMAAYRSRLGGLNPSDDTSDAVTFAMSIFAVDELAGGERRPGCAVPGNGRLGGSFLIPEDGGQ